MPDVIKTDSPRARCRAAAALRMLFVADALAMPVHWYYNPLDIDKDFPGGIKDMAAAPERHPSSIMALHSVSHGGRKAGAAGERQRQVGEGVARLTRDVLEGVEQVELALHARALAIPPRRVVDAHLSKTPSFLENSKNTPT